MGRIKEGKKPAALKAGHMEHPVPWGKAGARMRMLKAGKERVT